MRDRNLREAQYDCLALIKRIPWLGRALEAGGSTIPGLSQNISAICDYFSQPFNASANALQQVIDAAGAKYQYGGIDAAGKFLEEIAVELRGSTDQLKKISTAMKYLEPNIPLGQTIDYVGELAIKYGAIPPTFNVDFQKSTNKYRVHIALAHAKIGDLLLAASDASMAVSEEKPQNTLLFALLLPSTVGRDIEKQIGFVSVFGDPALWGLNPFSTMIKLRSTGERPEDVLGRLVYTVAFLRSPQKALELIGKIKEFFGVLEGEFEKWLYSVVNNGELAAKAAEAEIAVLKAQYYEAYTADFWIAMRSIIPDLRQYITSSANADLYSTLDLFISALISSSIFNISMRGGGGQRPQGRRGGSANKIVVAQNQADPFQGLQDALENGMGAVSDWTSSMFGGITDIPSDIVTFIVKSTLPGLKVIYDTLAESSSWTSAASIRSQSLLKSNILQGYLKNLPMLAAKYDKILETPAHARVNAYIMIVHGAIQAFDGELKRAAKEMPDPGENISDDLRRKWSIIIRSIFSKMASNLPTVQGPRNARPLDEGINWNVLTASTDIQSIISAWVGMDQLVSSAFGKVSNMMQTAWQAPQLGQFMSRTQDILSARPTVFARTIEAAFNRLCDLLDLILFDDNKIPLALTNAANAIRRGNQTKQERIVASEQLKTSVADILVKFIQFRIDSKYLTFRVKLENSIRKIDARIKKLESEESLVMSNFGQGSHPLGPIGPSAIVQALYYEAMKKADACNLYISNIKNTAFPDAIKVAKILDAPKYSYFTEIQSGEFIDQIKDFTTSQIDMAEAERAEALAKANSGFSKYKVGPI